ncbi:16586_t:CDS:1, partial [Gigaspora margarita]
MIIRILFPSTTQQNVNDPSNKHFIVDLNNEKTVGLQNSKNLLHTQKKSLVTKLIYNYLLNDVFDLLQCNNLEISDLQQKNLDKLFKYLKHFNKEFAKTNAHDNTFLKEKAKNLGSFYIQQRNVIIGNDIFRKVIKNKMDWYN